MIATVYNIFDFDWYERTFNVNDNATQYSAFLVNNDDALEMCGDVEVEKNKLQNFLRNFNTGLLKKNIPLYINKDFRKFFKIIIRSKITIKTFIKIMIFYFI